MSSVLFTSGLITLTSIHRQFARFRGKPIVVLEFGVSHGGSLQMWRNYFGWRAKIYGVDIDPRCKDLESRGTRIFIGDQEDREFLREIAAKIGPVDVLIEDGGHTMGQQIATFQEFYPRMAPNGVYLVEDLHRATGRPTAAVTAGRAPSSSMPRTSDQLNAGTSRTRVRRRRFHADHPVDALLRQHHRLRATPDRGTAPRADRHPQLLTIRVTASSAEPAHRRRPVPRRGADELGVGLRRVPGDDPALGVVHPPQAPGALDDPPRAHGPPMTPTYPGRRAATASRRRCRPCRRPGGCSSPSRPCTPWCCA
jgi:hypothetical protein